MAHGLESRVPLLDHSLVEFAATIPSNVKFKNGAMKSLFKTVAARYVPKEIVDRKDKMGFPTPFVEWLGAEAADFVRDTFSTQKAKEREWIDPQRVLRGLKDEPKYGRKMWGLLSLELWQQEFHDQGSKFKNLLKEESCV